VGTDHNISVSADALAHSQRVCSFLKLQIQQNGEWIPFSEWMHHALYAPGLGYYAAGNTKLAQSNLSDQTIIGDFVTAPQLTPLFGETIANQVAEILKQCGSVNVLEFGAGTGALANDVLTRLQTLGINARYSILEISADLKARQQDKLKHWGEQVSWLNSTPSDFVGCVLANEVLDAMPAEVFAWMIDANNATSSAARAVQRGVIAVESAAACAVTSKNYGDHFDWQDRSATGMLLKAIEDRCPPMPGYQSEINLQAEAWVREMGVWLKKGAAILIDYGFPQAEYYHPQRNRGTLMCHIHHRAHDDVFLAPGLQDITTHVDFTAIADAALAGSLEVFGYTSQARFLLNAGLTDLMMDRQKDPSYDTKTRVGMNAAVQKLISEAEMGELFKVMVIGREIDPPLLGFSRGDRRGQL